MTPDAPQAIRDRAQKIVLDNTVHLHGADRAEVLFPNLVATIVEELKGKPPAEDNTRSIFCVN